MGDVSIQTEILLVVIIDRKKTPMFCQNHDIFKMGPNIWTLEYLKMLSLFYYMNI